MSDKAAKPHTLTDRELDRRDVVSRAYPPELNGLRGHDGVAEVNHLLDSDDALGNPTAVDETYDLVVVGAGQSGLAAAYYYKSSVPGARILILESHDDFGGNAVRNEFDVDGRRVISHGGACMLVGQFRPSSVRMFRDIGLDLDRYRELPNSTKIYYNVELYNQLGLQFGVFFDRAIYGRDHTAVGTPGGTDSGDAWEAFLADAPIAEDAKRDFARLHSEKVDYMPGLSAEEKEERLRKMSYDTFLREVVGVHEQVADYYMMSFDTNYGIGADTISAWSVWVMAQDNKAGHSHWEFPGLSGLGLRTWGRRNIRGDWAGFFFPDGMAGICRLLVRWLVPAALPGETMEDSVPARVDYGALDRADSDVRLRLESAVVNVSHVGDHRTADQVVVTYVRDGKAYEVRAGACVMACYNQLVPRLCPELPEPQKEALAWAIRKPYVYASVAVRNWKAWHEMGLCGIYNPHGFFQHAWLSWPMGMGGYQCTEKPEDPSWIHLQRSPRGPGATAREQFQAARREMLEIPLEDYEREVRDLLARSLAPGGFDPARDITAITINRWPHGYAGGANDLYDPDWGHDEVPWVLGRRRFGRIAIANSDAAAMALANAAYEQAHRAVEELLNDVVRPQYWGCYSERN